MDILAMLAPPSTNAEPRAEASSRKLRFCACLQLNQLLDTFHRRLLDGGNCLLRKLQARPHFVIRFRPRTCPGRLDRLAMQVQRPLDDTFHAFHVAVTPAMARSSQRCAAKMTPADEVRVDMRAPCSRKASWEDIRPASPMAGTPKPIAVEARPFKPTSRRVHPDAKWTVVPEVESEPELMDDAGICAADGGSFRSLEVLSCFRAEASRGLRLAFKIMTAERFYAWWAVLLSLLLWPVLLMLAVVAGVGFLVLSTWVAIACAVVYPLAYLNPKLYNYAMDS